MRQTETDYYSYDNLDSSWHGNNGSQQQHNGWRQWQQLALATCPAESTVAVMTAMCQQRIMVVCAWISNLGPTRGQPKSW
jgi:hypothetical protein